MLIAQLKKSDSLLKAKEQRLFSVKSKDQAMIRNYRGKLQWSGNLDEMRIDK